MLPEHLTQSLDLSAAPRAFALGLRRRKGEVTLDVTFPQIHTEALTELGAFLLAQLNVSPGKNQFLPVSPEQLSKLKAALSDLSNDAPEHNHLVLLTQVLEQSVQTPPYGQLDLGYYFLFEGQEAVETPEEAYFKLQMMSQRHVQPHGICLDGAFRVLENIAWTNKGPILPADFEQERLKGLLGGEPLVVSHVDKFPYLVNYHLPSGVRVVSGSQVRLGAYLGEGSTVMPAGYVNFNAGAEANAMIEGRVSAGVFVKKNSDIGGGASIMGTLSGGNQHVISIGEKCLLGANAGAGISLGFGCTIAAGLYIYSGMKISLYNAENQPVNLDNERVEEGQNVVKAMELSGRDHLLFIQDSVSGKVICKPNPKTIELNADLHSHN